MSPTQPPPAARRDDEVVAAGMWRPGPDDEPAGPPESAIEAAVSEAIAGPGARSRDEIADSILIDSLLGIPRVLLLAAGRSGVTGWRSRGGGLAPDAVAAIRIPASEISVFSAVQESGIPHFGAVDRSEWPRSMAALLGAAAPDCAIFPIRILDGVAAFLYADRMGLPMQYEDFAVVARAAASAANVLSRFLLRADGSRSPVVR